MIHLGRVKPGSTIEFCFGSFAGSTGAPSATTNFAAADVQVYKDGGTAQRASASGITATADFDSQTGFNYISIDLSDNTTADFWAAGSRYTVVIADVTVDGQTVRFPVGTFRIGMEGALHDTTIATLSSQTSFTLAAGSADDSAYVGWLAYVHDAASAVQCCLGLVSAYTGSTKTVTLAADPGVFTMAAKDNISLYPPSLLPTVRGRTLDVSSGGEAGVDWANVGSPTTTVNLSGTTVKTATDVETDTADIQSRLPAALVSGRMDASVGAMASNTLTAAALATDAVAEIQSGLSTLDAAGVRTAVGLASANLDTQLTAIDDYLDTEVAAILAAVDTEVGAIKTVTDKLNATLEATSDGYHFTETALELAPSGTGASAATIAAAVWSESTRTLTAIDEDSTTLDLDATIRAAVGLASADLDTQLGDIATDAAAADIRGERTVCRGTVTTGASTTSIPTSALTPAGAAADQFKGRIIIFDIDTATAALRGQATDITASSNSSTPTFTVTALTSTPASGDTFTIV